MISAIFVLIYASNACTFISNSVYELHFEEPGTKIWIDSTNFEEVWRYDIPPNPLTRKIYHAPITLNFSSGFHDVISAKIDENGLASDVQTHSIGANVEKNKQYKLIQKKWAEHQSERTKFLDDISIKSVAEVYSPKYPELRFFKESYLTQSFRNAVRQKSLLPILTKASKLTDLFTLQIFSEEFLRKLFEELKHAETFDIPWTRPNSMNNQGFLLLQLGFEDFIDEFLQKWFIPMATMIYPQWEASYLDSVHAFTVKYETGGDLILDPHMDQSQLTLNTHIGGIHEGSRVKFNGILHDSNSLQNEHIEVEQKPGMSLLHVGQHWHESTSLESGERYNLIFWFRSRKSLQSPYEKFREKCWDENTSKPSKTEL
jgi:hypothetical protein